jgi:predicted dehydrogenase
MADLSNPPRTPIRFALIGFGWRARQFARIAEHLPDWFALTAILRRNPQGEEPVKVVADLDALMADRPDFAVLSVPRQEAPEYLLALADRGLPVLTETPPAAKLDELFKLFEALPPRARVQVAEQYPSQPFHQALWRLVASGRVGEVHHVEVSIAHGYHGIALIRRLLGVGFENATIQGLEVKHPLMSWPTRKGPPADGSLKESAQELGLIRFESGKSAVFDFAAGQYMSPIRTDRILVRGNHGEILNERVRWMKDHLTAGSQTIERFDGGEKTDLQGLSHQGYAFGDDWLYRNPFGKAPLPDDFIAMAHALAGMAQSIATGEPFYSLADGCQDHYLGLLLEAAAQDPGNPVRRSETQAWARR